MLYRLLTVGFVALAVMLAGPIAGLVSTPALAQAVGQILVEGNQRVEPETVRSYMQIQAGEAATEDKVDESIKSLFQTGLFSDVQIMRRGKDLVVKVEENPLINRVNFEGNSELDDAALAKEAELKERTIFTRSRVQADVQRLVALYRRSGYFAARIEPKIIRLPQNRVNLVFEIQEGVSTKVASINFIGNQAFSDYSLRSVITTGEAAWWKFFSTSDTYDPDRLNYDKELLRRYYLKNGFADFRVISATAELAPDGGSFYITFNIEEGPEYTVGNVAVNAGATALDSGVLGSAVTFNKGQLYDASKVDKSVETLTIEAGKAGYAFAKIQPDIKRDEANRRLDVVFNVQEGPRVYIERIDIVGNVRTLDEVIRRELQLYEGDAYNRILVDRARRRLTALDFFSKIDFKELPGTAADKVVLVIQVEEKSTGTVNFSAGYSTQEGVIGSVSVSERNFLGRGQYVNLATALSFQRQSVNFSFTEPYFLGRNIAAGVDAFATRTDQQQESSFTMQQVGGAVRAGFRISELARLTTKYQFTHRVVDVTDPNQVSLAIRDAAGTDNISLVSSTVTLDDLDNPLKPSSGYRIQTTGEVAGLGGDVHYGSVDAAAYYFMPLLFDGVVLKFKATGGQIMGWNGEDVPILDRFFKGGDSLRGFMRAGIGPRMERPNTDGATDSIGGETYGIGTVETTFPLGLPEEFGLEGAVFADAGTLFGAPEKNELDPDCTDGVCNVFGKKPAVRASVGAGLIWDSPFGPLRLDVAWPVVKESYDKTELVRFSVGTRF